MKEPAWDQQADIIVVGSGGGAHSAAITATIQGAKVIMLEKGAFAGGTTLRSGGGMWIPNNRFQREKGIKDERADAIRYMARYSYPQLYNPDDPQLGLPRHEYSLITTYYDNAYRMLDFMWDNKVMTTMQEINWTGKPQVDYMDHLPENKGVRGRVCYCLTQDGKLGYGGEMMRQLRASAEAYKIPLFLNHRATRIIQDDNGEVTGVEATTGDGKTVTFGADKAVVFCTGGYTHNEKLLLRFQRGPHFGGCAAPTNTGDFIFLAEEIGAQLANMAGAWRAELVLEETLRDPDGIHNVFFVMGDSILEVNRYGKRVMDEKRNYTDRTMTHFVWDPQRAEWTNMLIFMVYDQRTATLWQGYPPLPVQGAPAPYVITGDTLDALAKAIEERLKKLAPHTGGFGLDKGFADNLKRTVQEFNEFAKVGVDEDFGRGDYNYDREWTTFPPTIPGAEWPPPGSKNYTMYPLATSGPYYAQILAAGTLDTNGGPMINEMAQVRDTHGKAIPRLYGAGNCIASPTANAYWGGGSTLGPAMTFAHIAAINAVKEKARS